MFFPRAGNIRNCAPVRCSLFDLKQLRGETLPVRRKAPYRLVLRSEGKAATAEVSLLGLLNGGRLSSLLMVLPMSCPAVSLTASVKVSRASVRYVCPFVTGVPKGVFVSDREGASVNSGFLRDLLPAIL